MRRNHSRLIIALLRLLILAGAAVIFVRGFLAPRAEEIRRGDAARDPSR